MKQLFNNNYEYIKFQNKLVFRVLLFIEIMVFVSTLAVVPRLVADYENQMLWFFALLFLIIIALTVVMNIVMDNQEVKQLFFIIIAISIYLVNNLFYLNSLGVASSFIYFGLLFAVYMTHNKKYFVAMVFAGLIYYLLTSIFMFERSIIIISFAYYLNRFISLLGYIFIAYQGFKLFDMYKDTIEVNVNKVSDKNLELEGLNKELVDAKLSLDQQYDKIYRLAYFDSLTNLTNRSYFINHISELHQKYPNQTYTLMSLDIDNMKYVNNTYSHAVGDLLIFKVSQMLQEIVDKDTTVSRMGGDEIGILLIGEIDYEFMAEKIMMLFSQVLVIGDVELRIAVNMGVVHSKNSLIYYEEALRDVALALDKAKQEFKGKSHYVVYTEQLSESIYEQVYISKELQSAIETGSLGVVYQPKYNASSLKVVGFEALVRWTHHEMGFVSPSDFIPIAESYGVIEQLTNYVIEEACEFAKEVSDYGKNYKVTVNISGVQLIQNDFAGRVISSLYRTDTPSELIGIEITETAVMESLDMALENLLEIRSNGISISLDDFGTGYSSLNYLRQLPIDILKIDKSFVDNICTNQYDEQMIKMIIELAEGLGIKTIAEGVEVREQFELLKSLGCNYIQGYYFAKPMSKSECIKLIK